MQQYVYCCKTKQYGGTREFSSTLGWTWWRFRSLEFKSVSLFFILDMSHYVDPQITLFKPDETPEVLGWTLEHFHSLNSSSLIAFACSSIKTRIWTSLDVGNDGQTNAERPEVWEREPAINKCPNYWFIDQLCLYNKYKNNSLRLE